MSRGDAGPVARRLNGPVLTRRSTKRLGDSSSHVRGQKLEGEADYLSCVAGPRLQGRGG